MSGKKVCIVTGIEVQYKTMPSGQPTIAISEQPGSVAHAVINEDNPMTAHSMVHHVPIHSICFLPNGAAEYYAVAPHLDGLLHKVCIAYQKDKGLVSAENYENLGFADRMAWVFEALEDKLDPQYVEGLYKDDDDDVDEHLTRRVGMFMMPKESVDNCVEDVQTILAELKFIPYHVDFKYEKHAFEYIGISPKFNVLPEGMAAPLYAIETVTVGDRIVSVNANLT